MVKIPSIEKEVLKVIQVTDHEAFVAKYRLWSDGSRTAQYLTADGWVVTLEGGLMSPETHLSFEVYPGGESYPLDDL